ncbi:hypothetical protein HG531_002379 [Fusarium graminearum]|nr:hypothetical protein HG531_002379 [Fusarium graminearum]
MPASFQDLSVCHSHLSGSGSIRFALVLCLRGLVPSPSLSLAGAFLCVLLDLGGFLLSWLLAIRLWLLRLLDCQRVGSFGSIPLLFLLLLVFCSTGVLLVGLLIIIVCVFSLSLPDGALDFCSELTPLFPRSDLNTFVGHWLEYHDTPLDID